MGKFCFVIFLPENFGVHFCLRVAPHSGRGERPQLCAAGPCTDYLLFFFLGTLKNFYTNVCTCAHLRMCLLHCMHANSFALTL